MHGSFFVGFLCFFFIFVFLLLLSGYFSTKEPLSITIWLDQTANKSILLKKGQKVFSREIHSLSKS